MKWQPTSNKTTWEQFDSDVNGILATAMGGSVDQKMEAMTFIIYNVAVDRFGVENKKQHQQKVTKNRREKEIAVIRKDLRRLAKQYKRADEVERGGLADLRNQLRGRLKTLRRAERSRRRRKDRMKARAKFTSNPYQFTKKLLGRKASGKLQAEKEEVEEYLEKMHSNPHREEELGQMDKLLDPVEPSEVFDVSAPRLKEVKDTIRKARGGSSPGPNGVCYKVYKNSPRLTQRLWKLMRVAWRRGRLANSWYSAEGCFIPKEEDAKDLNQFRIISLLNVEGKIFLSVLARKMTRFMLDNGYIDIAVQKGGVPGVSGCIEHTSVLTQIIREAKEGKGELAVLWLHLANAYESIPHQLVKITLERYHVPTKMRDLLQIYYDSLKMRFSVRDYITDWQRLEVGIITG